MDKAKPISITMKMSCSLNKDENGKVAYENKYQGMIGSSLYLIKSCYNIKLDVVSVHVYKQTLKNTPHYTSRLLMCLWNPKGTNYTIVGYSDSDLVGCILDRKSIINTFHFLEKSLVSWYHKKQESVALSTTGAKYIVVHRLFGWIAWTLTP